MRIIFLICPMICILRPPRFRVASATHSYHVRHTFVSRPPHVRIPTATCSYPDRRALTWRILRNSRVANILLLSLWLKSHSQRRYPIHPASLPTVRMQRKRPIYMQPTKKNKKNFDENPLY